MIVEILRLAPQRLVYVSCDPATLSRDAHSLTEGGYRLIKALPIDLFPHTFHIEVLTTWEPA